MGGPLLRLRAFLSQEINEFFERNSLIIEQKLMVLANEYNEIGSAPLKKRLATAKEIGFSPKNHLKHFRKASFKNPTMVRNHSRVVSEQQKDKDKDIEESSKLCENSCFSEDNNEKSLLLQVQKILIAVRVAISPLNSKFFMNNMLFAKYETKISRILGPEVSEKLRYEALRWVYETHPADKASVQVYLSWKLKKWNAEFRREQVLKQKKKLDLQEFVICKICDQKVPEMNLLSHSGFCKKLEDLKEKTKQNVQNLSNKFQTGFADERRKENIKGTIIKNRIQRLNVKIRRIKQINRMDFENDEEIEPFPKKSNCEQLSLSDEECGQSLSMDTPQDLIKLRLVVPKEEVKISEFKEESDGQSDTPASMTVSIDFTSKLNRMRLMKNKNEVFISKEDISIENTPAEKMRRSCFDLGEKFKMESSEGEVKIRAMLQEEGEKLKINKKIIKYIDQFLDLINVYITMSPEAPSSAFLKLQQYFQNNSMVLGSMRNWIRKKDPIEAYENVWMKCDEAFDILKAQNECYSQILEAEKELKLLALHPKPKLRKEAARTFSISVQKHKNSEDPPFLTCKPPRAIERKPHFSLGGTKHLTFLKTEKESGQLISENNMKIDFSSIFKTPQEENKEVKEVRFSYQKPVILEKRDSAATGTSKFSKNIFSFEDFGEKQENEVKVFRKLKKTITSIESPPKTQERMSFLRRVSNVGLNGLNRSKTHLFYNEPNNNRLTIPSYNIIENFVHDKTISFPSKKKAIKQFLDTPICLGGNYIESYNSDGVLMTLKKKRAERKKSLTKINNAENRDDTEDSATEEDGDLSVCYMSDQMEKNHINDCKMNENK